VLSAFRLEGPGGSGQAAPNRKALPFEVAALARGDRITPLAHRIITKSSSSAAVGDGRLTGTRCGDHSPAEPRHSDFTSTPA
jgi:hypothetical protein